jgi:hypothetical protein
MELGMVVHAWNSSSWESGQESQEFEASCGYIARPSLKKTKERKQNKGGQREPW